MTTLDGLFDLTPNFLVCTNSPAYIRHAFTRWYSPKKARCAPIL